MIVFFRSLFAVVILSSPAVAQSTPPLMFQGDTSAVNALAWSPDGSTIIAGGSDGGARLFDLGTGEEIRRLEDHVDRWRRPITRSVGFWSDGKTAFTEGHGDTLLWNTETGRVIRRIDSHARFSVALSPDGLYAVNQGPDNSINLWEVVTGNLIREFEGHKALVFSMSFSPDGRFLLSGSADNTARVWDVRTGTEVLRLLGHTSSVRSVSFSPDGTLVATGSDDKTVWIWNATSGAPITRLIGHKQSVRSLAFSPDGRHLITGSPDSTARIWDVKTGKQVDRFEHVPGIRSVAYAPDGYKVASGADDGAVFVWQLDRRLWPAGPFEPEPRPRTLAVVIGNQDYDYAPDVTFAHKDAAAFQEFFVEVMGLDPGNVWLELNLGSTKMQKLFGTSWAPSGDIAYHSEFVDELFVVYIGHGIPGTGTKSDAYLLPVDVGATDAVYGGYSLSALQDRLAELDVGRVTVILDACFSGRSGGGDLVENVSGTFAPVAAPSILPEVTILSATELDANEFAH